MNKEQLKSVYEKYKNSYADLIKDAKARGLEEQWGMGVNEPLSLEPYRIELLGFKRGKMLKKASSPAPNRYLYLFDAEHRMVLKTEFLKKVGYGDEWLHAEDIFTYEAGAAIRFQFGSIRGDSTAAPLQRITYVAIKDGRVTNSYEYAAANEEYAETDYSYDGAQIVSVKMRLWYEMYTERQFKFVHEGKNLTILEVLASGEQLQTYPAPQ